MTTPTIRITGNELAEIAAADITDQATESAEALLANGWQGGGASYDLGVYHGDRDALAERLGYEPTREQLRDLETQIRAKLDEAAKPMVRIAVDYENDAETWWDNAKTAARREDNYPTNDMRDLPASCAALIGNADAVTVSAEEADAFRKWCEQIEGWRHGPEHAPHPFTFNDAD